MIYQAQALAKRFTADVPIEAVSSWGDIHT